MAEAILKKEGTDDRPPKEHIRGKCPECGEDLVSDSYYIEGEGYLIQWKCWNEACEYRRIL